MSATRGSTCSTARQWSYGSRRTGRSALTRRRIAIRIRAAGWSSLAARRAHNPKVIGSNPIPATNIEARYAKASGLFACARERRRHGYMTERRMTLSAIGTQWCTYPPRTRISRLAGCILPRGVLYGMNHCGQRPRRLGRKVRSASVARESRYGASEFGSPRRLPAGRVCFDIHQAGRRRGWHQTPRSRSVTRTCQQSGWARGHLTNTSPSADPESKKGRRLPALRIFGGRYWDRTSDPCRVKAVLYR